MGVVWELLKEEEEALHGLVRVVPSETAANEVKLLKRDLWQEQLLPSGAGFKDVHRRVDVVIREAAIEDDLHVASALKLLEDRLIGLRVGLNEGGSEDR